MADVWLRRTRRSRVALLVQMFLMLAIVLFVATAIGRWSGVPAGVIVWILAIAPIFLVQLVPRYRIHDDRLTVRWNRNAACKLSEVVLASAYQWRPVAGRVSSLMLTVNANVKIRLADDMWNRCYYQPEDLRALADSLAKSPHAQPQSAAAYLRRFADDPSREPWPPRSA